jgi:hypothetical protein
MAVNTEIIRGDSYAEDLINSTVLPTDLGYEDWTGVWAIVDKLESTSTPVASGILLKVDDPHLRLALRILPSLTSTIPVGTYKLVVQVTNDTLSFNKEVIQRTCKILPQGI